MAANGQASAQNPYPLSGIRVVDFCWVYAGPLMTRTLADYGAEVIKVESHKRLDGTRLGRPIIGDDITKGDEGLQPELQPLYHALNRNKHSITIDIREETGRALIHDLIAVSDVVTDNFSAGVLSRLGFGYEELRKIKPDIICASLSGAGQYGPLKDVPVYANTLGPLSGVGLLLGYPPDKPMGASQFAWGDACATIRGVGAIAMALYHRKRTGEGQYIDVSELDCNISGLDEPLLDYQMNGRVAGPQGNTHPVNVPNGIYRCAGDDRWISISVETEEQWRALCGEMGRPELASAEKFADGFRRWQNRDELDETINAWTADQPDDELTKRLQAAGVAAFPCYHVQDKSVDPHFREREYYVENDHPRIGVMWVPGTPWKFSESKAGIQRHAPELGEHNEYVFNEVLGLGSDRLEELVESGIVH